MKRKKQCSLVAWGALLGVLWVGQTPLAAEMNSLPVCAPEFREGPAISMDSWLSGQGECRADETMLEVTTSQSQLAGRAAAAEEEKPTTCEWEPAVAQPVC